MGLMQMGQQQLPMDSGTAMVLCVYRSCVFDAPSRPSAVAGWTLRPLRLLGDNLTDVLRRSPTACVDKTARSRCVLLITAAAGPFAATR